MTYLFGGMILIECETMSVFCNIYECDIYPWVHSGTKIKMTLVTDSSKFNITKLHIA